MAGLIKYSQDHDLTDQTVVCVITGHGLKDPDTALSIEAKMTDIPADEEAVERALRLR